MRYQRILLVAPSTKANYGSLRPHIGLGYLAQMLLENSIEYDVLDMMLGYSPKDLLRRLDYFQPDLVGVSLFSYGYKRSYGLIAQVKKHNPGIDIVVGGPHVSSLRKAVFEECPPIDYGIALEGEYALLELCQGKDLKEIKGLMFRDRGSIVFNGEEEFIADLDSLPFPTYKGFELERYMKEKSLISSRGCPYCCTFCAVGATIGTQVRVRSPQNVVNEMQYWYEKGTRQFSFQDDNFTLYRKRVFEICDEIERRGFKNLLLRCGGARADKVDSEVLTRMKEVGFRTIAFGVEAGNDRILKVLKKAESLESIENAIKSACDLGYDVYLNFLAGSPKESLSDVKDSMKVAQKYPVFYIQFFNIIPYPGTELYRWLQEKGYLLRQPEDYLNDTSPHSQAPIFETPELPAKVRKKLFPSLRKVERQVLRQAFDRRLEKKRLPCWLRRTIAYLASSQWGRSLFFGNLTIRRLAERVRFSLYMQR